MLKNLYDFKIDEKWFYVFLNYNYSLRKNCFKLIYIFY